MLVILRFNPRPSCEGRCSIKTGYLIEAGFQSAPLLRGAIILPHCLYVFFNCFNPRPSCEGR